MSLAPVNEAAEFARTLGFSPAWFALGVVDEAVLARQRAEWDKGQDANPEHYRYGASRQFLAARRPLPPELAAALYELGTTRSARQDPIRATCVP